MLLSFGAGGEGSWLFVCSAISLHSASGEVWLGLRLRSLLDVLVWLLARSRPGIALCRHAEPCGARGPVLAACQHGALWIEARSSELTARKHSADTVTYRSVSQALHYLRQAEPI